MAYEVVMPYHLHMPSYFLETFTEYPLLIIFSFGNYVLLKIIIFFASSNLKNEEL